MREILPPIILPLQDHLRLEALVADALRDRHPVSSFLMSEETAISLGKYRSSRLSIG